MKQGDNNPANAWARVSCTHVIPFPNASIHVFLQDDDVMYV